MMPTPWPRSRLSVANSAPVSASERDEVGSSRIRTREFTPSARAISTICCRAVLRVATGASGSPISARPRSSISRRAWANMRRRSTRPNRTGSRPRNRFSATERFGASESSWWITRIPSRSASATSRISTRRPSSSIVPESGRTMPPSTLISVDFPAPFSPSRAWISPARSAKSTASRAVTPPNRFVIPRSASRGRSPVGSSGMGLVHWLFRNSSAFSLVTSLTGILMSFGTVLPAR